MSYWEARDPRGGVVYVQVMPSQVLVGSHQGSGHTDSAGTSSFEEFLEGRFHDVIRAGLGAEVLDQVVGMVKVKLRAAGSDDAAGRS